MEVYSYYASILQTGSKLYDGKAYLFMYLKSHILLTSLKITEEGMGMYQAFFKRHSPNFVALYKTNMSWICTCTILTGVSAVVYDYIHYANV